MPDRQLWRRHDARAEQLVDHREQAVDRLCGRKIGPQLLLRQRVARQSQLLRCVGNIPSLQIGNAQLRLREIFQLLILALRQRLRLGGKIAQEAEHLVTAAGHFRRERQRRVILEAEQSCQLLAGVEDIDHLLGVVPLAGAGALVGGARGVGGVELAAQLAVLGVLHRRQIGGGIERDDITVESARMRRLLVDLQRGRRHAAQALGIGDVLAPALGSVEHVVRERGTELGELLA
ncbi:conserved hypothetical protein [Ricinus communis]|uniref:Uncharacterized protein n=1 Tax=Ricinus communis TaxID=3988 RepID=B9TLU6_RICCO|nr:conserved hypothetical protein [Ricinus communis]